MISIVVRKKDHTYIGTYDSPVVPQVDTIISTPYTNYLVVAVQHNLNNKLSTLDQTIDDITVYVREDGPE